MWRKLCTLLFVLALAGVIGEAPSFAAAAEPPEPATHVMDAPAGCHEQLTPDEADDPAAPCGDASSDCMARAGCTSVAVTLPSGAEGAMRAPSPGPRRLALTRDDTRAGQSPTPLGNPPKLLA